MRVAIYSSAATALGLALALAVLGSATATGSSGSVSPHGQCKGGQSWCGGRCCDASNFWSDSRNCGRVRRDTAWWAVAVAGPQSGQGGVQW